MLPFSGPVAELPLREAPRRAHYGSYVKRLNRHSRQQAGPLFSRKLAESPLCINSFVCFPFLHRRESVGATWSNSSGEIL